MGFWLGGLILGVGLLLLSVDQIAQLSAPPSGPPPASSSINWLEIVGAATSVVGLIKLVFETLKTIKDFFAKPATPKTDVK